MALIHAVPAGPERSARGDVLTPAWPSPAAAVATWPEHRVRATREQQRRPGLETGYEPLKCNLNLSLRCLILGLGSLIWGKNIGIFGTFDGFCTNHLLLNAYVGLMR